MNLSLASALPAQERQSQRAFGFYDKIIAEIYSELFGIAPESLSPNAHFLDLGGTSLDIIRLKQRLEARFGIFDLPIVKILHHMTIRELAGCVAPERRYLIRDYDPVIPLQLKGPRIPLFCVHPGTGDVLVFLDLAKRFRDDRPFYALRARGFEEGENHFFNFDEMIATYVRAIRKRQPHGPYAIAGYSYGGAVAFEIAKWLEAQGECVPFVGSIDMAPRPLYLTDPVESAIQLAFYLALIDEETRQFASRQLRGARAPCDPSELLFELASEDRLAVLDLDLAKFKRWVALVQSLVTIGRGFVPCGTVESVCVFYAETLQGAKEDWVNGRLKQWDEFTRAPNRYIEVPGEHHTLMRPKHVDALYQALHTEIDGALSGR